ncbi:MAG: hypothetical protein AAGA80_01015 [Cyanobacteria bacterium P01_F01_bin.143]
MSISIRKATIDLGQQKERAMNNENQSYHLEQEILELKQSCFELNQELEAVKKLLQQRQISPKQAFLFIKVLIFILVGINAQSGNFQFNGDHLLPMVDTLSNEEIDNNL